MQSSFKDTLQSLSTGCRNRLGFVVPWELILAIITMIAEYCQGLESPEEFCRKSKQPGPFAKWVLWWKADRIVRAYDHHRLMPSNTAGAILDELFSAGRLASDDELRSFHKQLTAVMRGADPDEV